LLQRARGWRPRCLWHRFGTPDPFSASSWAHCLAARPKRKHRTVVSVRFHLSCVVQHYPALSGLQKPTFLRHLHHCPRYHSRFGRQLGKANLYTTADRL
jgi:hypothetical protein